MYWLRSRDSLGTQASHCIPTSHGVHSWTRETDFNQIITNLNVTSSSGESHMVLV